MTPKSPLGRAIKYTLGLWPRLEVFLRHGEVEAYTNLTENAIRPTAVGKKNWMFVGGEDTGERSAVIYTILESARRHGHDPGVYLKDVLERLPRDEGRRARRPVAGQLAASRSGSGPGANGGLRPKHVNGCPVERLRCVGEMVQRSRPRSRCNPAETCTVRLAALAPVAVMQLTIAMTALGYPRKRPAPSGRRRMDRIPASG